MDKKRVLFIDRDGTIIREPIDTYQIDTLELLEFLPGAIRNLYTISNFMNFELAMVSNQDGLGTAGYPEADFQLVQQKMIGTLKNESIIFDNIFIDPSFPEENSPRRKPKTGMLTGYFNESYDLNGSYVIGDRLTDIELAYNMGASGILYNATPEAIAELEFKPYNQSCVLIAKSWDEITTFLAGSGRTAEIVRKTNETDILVKVNLNGSGKSDIQTGIGFFDHMLAQISKHGEVDLTIHVNGDLEVDEHHTIEDTAIALGEAFLKALGDKRGIERYGFLLPMDESLAQVAIDFGGRPWLVWNAEFTREKIGEMPTEMFFHFFKSFTDAARCNLNIKVEGSNEHHKIEGIFKAFAKAIKMAIRKDPVKNDLPSTKGML